MDGISVLGTDRDLLGLGCRSGLDSERNKVLLVRKIPPQRLGDLDSLFHFVSSSFSREVAGSGSPYIFSLVVLENRTHGTCNGAQCRVECVDVVLLGL